MRPFVLALVVVPLLTSGCFDHCGPFSTATWTEPGLYHHLAQTHEVHGVPEDGLVFDDATHLPGRGPMTLWRLTGPAVAQQDETRHDRHRSATTPMLQAPGWEAAPWVQAEGEPDSPYVRVDADDQHTDEVRSAAAGFVARLGGNASDQWLDTLLADPHTQAEEFDREGNLVTTFYAYTASFPGTPDVDGLAAGLDLANASKEAAFGGDHVYLKTPDGWELSIQVQIIKWRLDPDKEPATVNVFDHIRTGLPEDLAGNETASQDWIMDRFGVHSAPGPTFEAWEYSTVVC